MLCCHWYYWYPFCCFLSHGKSNVGPEFDLNSLHPQIWLQELKIVIKLCSFKIISIIRLLTYMKISIQIRDISNSSNMSNLVQLSCSPDPSTNFETRNPVFSRIFLPIASDEKKTPKQILKRTCSLWFKKSWKFRFLRSELIVGSLEQNFSACIKTKN